MHRSAYIQEHSTALLWAMRALDVIVIMAAALFSHALVFGHLNVSVEYRNAIAYAVLLALFIYPYCQVYRAWRGSSELDETRTLAIAWTLMFACLITIAFILKESSFFSRLWTGTWYLSGLTGWISSRMALRLTLRVLRKKGYNQKQVAVIGTGQQALEVREKLRRSRWTGFNIAGFYHCQMDEHQTAAKDLNISGNLAQLVADIKQGKIQQVWIALSLGESRNIDNILQKLDHETVDIRLIPDLLNFRLLNHSVSEISGMPILNLSMSPMYGTNRILKSIEDKVLASLILVLISPIMLTIAVMIKTSSPGPVFFKQKRHGLGGKEIRVYKFRSMHVHKEEHGKITQASKGDPRVTKLGAFMRRTSIDELPQFINVLQGRMSIVGPRPHALAHNRYYQEKVESYMKRHKVKPGITGWAQVSGFRGETDTIDKMEKRVEYDLYYIQNWSLWFDIRIIVMTVFKGFIGRNAY